MPGSHPPRGRARPTGRMRNVTALKENDSNRNRVKIRVCCACVCVLCVYAIVSLFLQKSGDKFMALKYKPDIETSKFPSPYAKQEQQMK